MKVGGEGAYKIINLSRNQAKQWLIAEEAATEQDNQDSIIDVYDLNAWK